MASASSFLSLAFFSSIDFRSLTTGAILLAPGVKGGVGNGEHTAELMDRKPGFSLAEDTDDLFVGKTLHHGNVIMWLMKTLLTSRCTNQRGTGQILESLVFIS